MRYFYHLGIKPVHVLQRLDACDHVDVLEAGGSGRVDWDPLDVEGFRSVGQGQVQDERAGRFVAGLVTTTFNFLMSLDSCVKLCQRGDDGGDEFVRRNDLDAKQFGAGSEQSVLKFSQHDGTRRVGITGSVGIVLEGLTNEDVVPGRVLHLDVVVGQVPVGGWVVKVVDRSQRGRGGRLTYFAQRLNRKL